MIKIIEERRRESETWHELMFDDGFGNGFGFPCDKDGNVEELKEPARTNFLWCLDHPEHFKRNGVVVERKHSWIAPAIGQCHCGHEVILINEYNGACECQGCGQWYNLFGQEILTPDQWC